MEKFLLFIKKIFALSLSSVASIILFGYLFLPVFNSSLEPTLSQVLHILFLGEIKEVARISMFWGYLAIAINFIMFAFLLYKITDEKPRFLFGLNQVDSFLEKKGGFWTLFKWILIGLGMLYDLVVWAFWGVYNLFLLIAEVLLFLKTFLYWIFFGVVWLIRQFFPPIVFIFKMVFHYLVNWSWWIYRLAVRNVKITINRNFYYIALWGTIPALVIIFLFYAISKLADIPELVVISVLFALVPIVWSFGEISALRFSKRELDDFAAVQGSFSNGFDAIRSVLFYLVVTFILIVAELVLNMVGWIPNLSMSFLGITINLNMAISIVLVFMTVVIVFAACILPTHILYNPEHENDIKSSLGFLRVIGVKFLRYLFVKVPSLVFGSLLMVIPAFVIVLAFGLTDSLKKSVLDARIDNLKNKVSSIQAVDAHRIDTRIGRMEMYKNVPLHSEDYFLDLRRSRGRIEEIKTDLNNSKVQLVTRRAAFEKQISGIDDELQEARIASSDNPVSEEITYFTNQKLDIEKNFREWEKMQTECIAFLEVDLKEQKGIRSQMPVLFFFTGIFFAVFGGLVVAVLIAYLGNVYFELYLLREDDQPSYWTQTLKKINEKDRNQPLLGFTFIGISALVLILLWWQSIH